MSTVSTSLRMNDQMTSIMRGVVNSLHMTLSAMEDMDRAMDKTFDDSSIQAARNSIRETELALKSLDVPIEEAAKEQSKFNDQLKKGSKEADELSKGLKSVFGLVLGYVGITQAFEGLGFALGLSDELTNTQARLNMINDGLQTQAELQRMIFDAAQRSYGLYSDMSATVAKLSMNAKDAFSSNAETILFAENLNKLFTIAGTEVFEMQSATLQLTQALGSGVLRGEELNAVFEAAPNIIHTIADYLDVNIGQIRELASEGKITADIVKRAMLGATDEINKKFESMPLTFSRIWTMFKNNALNAFQPVLEQLNDIANNKKFQAFVDSATASLQTIAIVTGTALSWLTSIGAFIYDHWSTIAPIFIFVGGTISTLITYFILLKGAIALATAGMWLLNNVIKANPILFIVSLITGLISTLIYLYRTNDKVAVAIKSAWYSVLNFFDQIPIFMHMVGSGIVNAFMDARTRSLQIMDGLVNGVIDGINKLIGVLNNAVPGLQLEAISHINLAANAALEAESVRQRESQSIANLQAKAHLKQLERAKELADFQAERSALREQQTAKKASNGIDVAKILSSLNNGTGKADIGKVDEVGKIKDTVDISSEDIKMLRELAEMRNIQNFVTLTPQISVQTGDIRETADTEEIINRITERLEEELISSASGVYT